MRHLACAVALLLLVAARAAGAQEVTTAASPAPPGACEGDDEPPRTLAAGRRVDPVDIRALAEPSYITAFGGVAGNRDPLLFEGNIAPSFSLAPAGRVGISVTPKVVLRMFRERSLPVRTPSYMPRVTVYVPVGGAPGSRVNDYLVFTASHHSNGQSGPFRDSTGAINLVDGNFSTNFLALGWQGVVRWGRFCRLNGYSVSVEHHPRGFMNGDLRGLYPPTRIHGAARFVARPRSASAVRLVGEDVELTGRLTGLVGGQVPEAGFGPSRLNYWGTVALRPPWLDELAVFVNGFVGQDYYNLRFGRRLSVLRVGFSTANPTRQARRAPSPVPPA